MSRVINMVKNIDSWAALLIMILILIVVFLQIMSRVIPGNAISWTIEVGEMLLSALIWLAISVGVTNNAHVSFDLIVKNLPLKVRKVVVSINNFLFMGYLVLLGFFTVQVLGHYLVLSSTSTILGISMFWVRMPILIGCILTVIRLAVKQYRIFTGKEAITFSGSTQEGGVE